MNRKMATAMMVMTVPVLGACTSTWDDVPLASALAACTDGGDGGSLDYSPNDATVSMNVSEYDEPESYEAVQCLVETLGNSTELENRIGTTNALAGQQTMDVDGYRWSWTYSSQNGFAGTVTAIGNE